MGLVLGGSERAPVRDTSFDRCAPRGGGGRRVLMHGCTDERLLTLLDHLGASAPNGRGATCWWRDGRGGHGAHP